MPKTRPVKTITDMADLSFDPMNANKGTERGRAMVEHSLRTYGAGRSILVDRNGVVIAGNKTLENAAAIDLGVRVVQSDGHDLVVVQRTDLDINDPNAKELAIADNRAAEVSLSWDDAALRALADGGADLSPFWFPDELAAALAQPAPEPTFAPVGIEEQGRLDEKAMTTCPNCGHVF